MLAFNYHTTPIAHDPPWTSEDEHMAALEAFANLAFPGYELDFVFEGGEISSYANVIAGIPANNSNVSGKSVNLYYESIFNHEFANFIGVAHHYDTLDEIGDGNHMPPGESCCIMDRNANQFCSACRTALHIPLDIDNESEIIAAGQVISSRYPY